MTERMKIFLKRLIILIIVKVGEFRKTMRNIIEEQSKVVPLLNCLI